MCILLIGADMIKMGAGRRKILIRVNVHGYRKNVDMVRRGAGQRRIVIQLHVYD